MSENGECTAFRCRWFYNKNWNPHRTNRFPEKKYHGLIAIHLQSTENWCRLTSLDTHAHIHAVHTQRASVWSLTARRWKLALSIYTSHWIIHSGSRACKWNESNEQSSGKKSAYSLVDSSLPQWAIDKNKRATTALLSFWSINVSDQWCKGLILIFIRLMQMEYGHENVKCGSKTD